MTKIAGIFRPIYRNGTTAWMQELEQRKSSCRAGQSILGQPSRLAITTSLGIPAVMVAHDQQDIPDRCRVIELGTE